MKKIQIKVLTLLLLFSSFNAFGETFVFAHGYGGDSDQYRYYKQPRWSILAGKVVSFNFPEVFEDYFVYDSDVNNDAANFGQNGDIQSIKKAVDGVLAKNSKEEIVLVGVSRGASALINYASRYPKNIKAMVLEAPFDDFSNVVDNVVAGYSWVPGIKNGMRYWTRKKFPSYDPYGITPLKSLKDLSKHNIPILFVHSYKDKVVPISCSWNLYWNLIRELREQSDIQSLQRQVADPINNGKASADKRFNIHFLELASGRHASYQVGSRADRYLFGVHAFYKKYNIKHDPYLAQEGENLPKYEGLERICCLACKELYPKFLHECPKSL